MKAKIWKWNYPDIVVWSKINTRNTLCNALIYSKTLPIYNSDPKLNFPTLFQIFIEKEKTYNSIIGSDRRSLNKTNNYL